MSGLIGKMAPTAVVAAAAAWCCWPYVGEAGSGGGAKKPSGPPQITQSLLAPSIAPRPGRDAFYLANSPQSESSQKKGLAGKKVPGGSAALRKGALPEKNPADVFKGLALSGTYLGGSRPAALINGRLWQQGERLALVGDAANPWIVGRISPHGVLIEHGGQTFELKYAGPEAKPAPHASTASAAATGATPRSKSAAPAAKSKTGRDGASGRPTPTPKAKPGKDQRATR